VLQALASACTSVSCSVRTASCDSYACFNELGGEQLAVDMLAEEALLEGLRACGLPLVTSTLWDQALQQTVSDEPAKYAVVLDPLDGSSIIDTNFAVGTLFSIWSSPTSLVNVTGRQLIAAGACTYGPRTSLYLAHGQRAGVREFLLVGGAADGSEGPGRWVAANDYEALGEGKLFSPGNLRAMTEHTGYAELVRYWQENSYQLRYTGGMVSDTMQLLIKGRGVYVTPAAPGKRPRPRLLYEAIPLAFLIEKGGGSSSNGGTSVLDVTVRSLDQRTQLALGSAGEVRRFEDLVGTTSLS